jgi:hypothetical protein
MRQEKSHYQKVFDTFRYITVYHCDHYNDIGFIPKDKCWDGDLVYVKRGDLKYVFKKGNWEMVR